jgi:hypothetical protein
LTKGKYWLEKPEVEGKYGGEVLDVADGLVVRRILARTVQPHLMAQRGKDIDNQVVS